jgi:hypothetical protein
MLEEPSHGSWYYWIKVTDADGLRKRVRQGGFASEQAAIAARDAAIIEPSPRVLAQAWTVEKWRPTGWISWTCDPQRCVGMPRSSVVS